MKANTYQKGRKAGNSIDLHKSCSGLVDGSTLLEVWCTLDSTARRMLPMVVVNNLTANLGPAPKSFGYDAGASRYLYLTKFDPRNVLLQPP